MSTGRSVNEPSVDSVEAAVRQRYSQGAQQREAALCCPVDYNTEYLKVLPAEILERDYGCGDPSRFVREGDVVLDLGSGGGKICYIAAQIVGARGRVIGVDWNDDMLTLAEKYKGTLAERLGYANVDFRKGKIQDLALDYARVEAHLKKHPVVTAAEWIELEGRFDEWRRRDPMIADESVDIILSNCVLNLVKEREKKQLFAEMYRVLKRGGRVAISDIVSDEVVPEVMKRDPELWSGCLSGAFQETEFMRAFEEAGFYGVELAKREDTPWRVLDGIEFRSVTVTAWKGKDGPCFDHNQAVIYRGPWKEVLDDDGHRLRRGERMAVCKKTYEIYTREPYAQDVFAVAPLEAVPDEEAPLFDCRRDQVRPARETKGLDYRLTDLSGESCCDPGGKCC